MADYGYNSLGVKERTKQELRELKNSMRRIRRTSNEKMTWDEFFREVVIPAIKKERKRRIEGF